MDLKNKENINMDTKRIETWKHQEDTFKLQREIMEHVKAIRSLEEKLVSLRTDDLCEDLDLESIPCQSLWRNLELIEKNPSSYSQTQQQFDEEPCYSTLDLVVQKLLHTPKSPLQMKGCSIHSLGKSVQFCISGEVDENVFGQNHE
jgi:hypothetical protein